jgi:GNAT superfamily N-acetyltransferase
VSPGPASGGPPAPAGRLVLSGPDGRPALSYVPGERGDHPRADLVEQLGDAASAVALAQLPGWALSTEDTGLAESLVDAGARVLRRASVQSRDLRTDPAPAAVAPARPDRLRLVPCDRPARDLLAAWLAAYPPGHPDHEPGTAAQLMARGLVPLLDGSILGPLLRCSALVVDGDAVVAGCLVNGRPGDPPLAGPWVSDVFRDPAPAYAGTGARLLEHALAVATADGLPALSLAVSRGNPARRVYERLRFLHAMSAVTVLLPGH